MYERFTDRARKVMQLANEDAQWFEHEYIGTEHILLGLVQEGSGVAANVLKNLNVDLPKIRLEVERIIQPGRKGEASVPSLGRRPQTPRTKKVIEYAIEEARNFNHNYVGTEHLLLGLLREQEGLAAQVLMNLGLKLGDVREEVLKLLEHNPPADGSDVVLHRIDVVLNPTLTPSAPLPAEFATLDVVISKLSALKERAVKARKFVESAWYAEQVDALRQVREAIVRRLGPG